MNHTEYQRKTKRMSAAELHFTIKDCQEALRAMPDNPKASHYADEISYCAMELHRRRNSK